VPLSIIIFQHQQQFFCFLAPAARRRYPSNRWTSASTSAGRGCALVVKEASSVFFFSTRPSSASTFGPHHHNLLGPLISQILILLPTRSSYGGKKASDWHATTELWLPRDSSKEERKSALRLALSEYDRGASHLRQLNNSGSSSSSSNNERRPALGNVSSNN
jgi:hypothetical protein